MEWGRENILVMIPAAELEKLQNTQKEILELLQQSSKVGGGEPVQNLSGYVTAIRYMEEVGIRRWKFNQLIAENKIKTLKKKRKIYVPVAEIERFFKDPAIQ
jgi:hypothetical protein